MRLHRVEKRRAILHISEAKVLFLRNAAPAIFPLLPGNASPSPIMNRREFIARTAAAGFALGAANAARALSGSVAATPATGDSWLQRARADRKIDGHAHVGYCSPDALLKAADQFGVERLLISYPFGDNPPAIRRSNDLVLQCVREHPDRFIGQCFLDPRFPTEAMEELRRCLGEGMTGLGELYHNVKINDPLYYPLIEYCIPQRASLMWHGRSETGFFRKGYAVGSPWTTSTPDDFLVTAARYPEAILIYGHIGGGGDWQYACKALAAAPSIHVSVSGSVTDAAMVDYAVEQLGAKRVLFGSDLNFETGVGKVLSATLTPAERRLIFWDNMDAILQQRARHAR